MDVYELTERVIAQYRQGTISPDDNTCLVEIAKAQTPSVRKTIAEMLLKEEGRGVTADIWLYSFAIAVNPDERILKNLIMMVKMAYQLDYKQKYFLFQQINSIIFQYPDCNTEDVVRMAWGLLDEILRDCKKHLSVPLRKIPVSQLNKGISIVLVEQYLTAEHGPTKTALDRCYVLKKQCGQDVMLINTAELLSPANCVYFENASIGNYIPELSTKDQVSWQGETFRFYQCAQDMPDEKGLLELVSFVQAVKPASIVLVGGTSLAAGVLNELVPVVTVGTIQSGLAMTLAQYQVIDGNMLAKSYALLERMGKPRDHIIPGKFTFSLKPQTQTLTREAVGIDADAFAIAVVGGRLQEEVTDEFLAMLETCVQQAPGTKKLVIGLIGGCADIEQKLARHPNLAGHVVDIGFAKDILSVVEQFDLYVNPIRRGGGTSAVEAMSKGLPVVTVDYGDVAGIVGADFCCVDYAGMQAEIHAYMTDAERYRTKAAQAKQLAELYLDSAKEFARIMQDYYTKTGVWMDHTPVLTVVVPCYNVEAYVSRCVESILHQTIGIERLEILLINDASTDNTLEILKRYERQYPDNIRVIDLQENAGLSHARNVGIREAATGYVAFVDSDDWISPGMYEDMYVNGMAKGCDLAVCSYDRPVAEGKESKEASAGHGYLSLQSVEERRLLLEQLRTNVYAWNKIWKKSFFTEYDIWYPEGLCYEDNYPGFLALLLCKKLYVTDMAYYHWYKNPESITGTNRNLLDRLEVQRLLLDKINAMNQYDLYAEIVDYNFYEKTFVECFLAYVKAVDIELDNIKELRSFVLEAIPQISQNPYFLGHKSIDHMFVAEPIGHLITENITEQTIRDVLKAMVNV